MGALSYISPLPSSELASDFPRSVALLGSTGSIGVSALKVIAASPEDFRIVALAGARNISRLAEQAAEHRPPYLGVLDAQGAQELKELLPSGYTPEIVVGPEGYEYLARMPEARYVLAAQVGAAGLRPALAAAETGKIIGLANKEALVLAGNLIREACHKSGAVILPVDSEHNALFQCLEGHAFSDVENIILTASGGPFRGRDAEFLQNVTKADALNHPNWEMGAKITIDSATLMNKGLEVIEAHHLYGIGLERIEVVVHPQSIIHSLVSYHDGSLLAHMGLPDMQIPIAYCLAYPKRLPLDLPKLNLAEMAQLTFEAPNLTLFPCLKYAMESLKPGPGAAGRPVVLNAANEVAVARFLEERIRFMDIPRLVGEALADFDARHKDMPEADTVQRIIHLDEQTRTLVDGWIADGK